MLLGGRYEIIRELGRGGFGKTYLAEDTYRRGGAKCVVKKIQPRLKIPALLEACRSRFEAETQLLYQLGAHAQIPKLYAHFEQNGEFYLVQELIDGSNLRQNLTLGRKLDDAEAIDLLREILEIVASVHQQQVVHQDLKPDNLIRRWKDKKLVLLDFGGVKALRNLTLDAQGHVTLAQASGTPGYMPIEQIDGNPQFASDIYAIGMMGIQSLTGLLPTQIPRDPVSMELSWHDQAMTNPQLTAILDKMVRYRIEERYQSISEVLADFPVLAPVMLPTPVLEDNTPPEPEYRLRIQPQYEGVCNFSEGLAGVVVDGKLGFIDPIGNFVIPPKLDFSPISMFRGAYLFSEGLARIDIQGRWGYIDKTGEFAIPPQYDSGDAFAEGIARIERNHHYGYIDRTGRVIVPPQFESAAATFSEGLAAVEIDHLHGYIDKTGKVAIEPQFDSADDFAEGLARITLDHRYGFIDKTGRVVIEPQFDVVHTFSEGLARARIDGKYGYIDTQGKVVIPPQFDDTFSFSNGLALIRNGAKYGYIDKTGKTVIRLQFDDAYPFSCGLAAVKLISLWGYINSKGDMAIDLQFEDAGAFAEGRAAVKKGGKWGYVGY
ncbi:MAG: WG repeat-containing protein [Leptolyngbyaceae cyanobacterium bins.59]|nr:WG repeat-containing protein [Leptolyngbyaceae cyanobacterium bins.59]